jgi:23S rRNA pseudouridine2604 synthase
MPTTLTYDGDEPQRVNKWLAQAGVCSRREAEAHIAAGRVSIDGKAISEPGQKISAGQTLVLQDAGVAFAGVVNKPIGFVSAQPERGQTPAARLLVKANQIGPGAPPSPRTLLAPLGRLDMDSRGLLLLSDDGVLAKAIIGPQSAIDKEYVVTVSGLVTHSRLQQLRHGLHLDGRALKPAIVTQEDRHVLRFVLTEGRNRQIRRMCALVGLEVTDLVRVRIGPLALRDLREGCWRHLTGEERAALIAAR